MDAGRMLIEAQMHLECMNEAFFEMERGDMQEERQKVVYSELIARLWASIHLVQSVRLGRRMTGLPRLCLRRAASTKQMTHRFKKVCTEKGTHARTRHHR